MAYRNQPSRMTKTDIQGQINWISVEERWAIYRRDDFTCQICGDQFYTPFAWVDGRRVDERQVCGGCGGQGALFGEGE